MENKNFESAMAELEQIVKTLENDVELEKGVELFKKGIDLTNQCMSTLKSEKGKILLLVDELNNLTENFGETDDNN